MTADYGRWPADWPVELEPFRASARTIDVATGIQQTVFEIEFEDREEFGRAWSAILKVATPGSTVTLYAKGDPPPESLGTLLHNDKPSIRIYAPCDSLTRGTAKSTDTTSHPADVWPPWPPPIVAADGILPEYVRVQREGGNSTWVAAEFPNNDPDKATGSYFRARVDLDVVVDGIVIDRDSVVLPHGTAVADKRLPRLKEDVAPKLTQDQCNQIVAAAHKTFRSAAQQKPSNAQAPEIPSSCWSDVVQALNPIRVINDRVNVKLVLKDDGQFEAGFYVILGISSFRPQPGEFVEFVNLGKTGESFLGEVYWFRQAKAGSAEVSPNTTMK